MNGSKNYGLTSKIKIKHGGSSNTVYLDVYEMALSFYDGLVYDEVTTANSPTCRSTTFEL